MAPKTALLHIGTPKTGTTSIQGCLKFAESTGRLGAYRYPLAGLGYANQNQLLSTLYLAHEDLPPFIRVQFPEDDERFRGAQRRSRRLLFRALQSAKGAILSAEILGNCFSLHNAIELRRDLESLGFEEFHIVLYIRDAADYYLSAIQQRLKTSAAINSVDEIIDPLSFRYGFRSIAANWEKAFPGRVIVRGYLSGPGTDVVEDFSQLLQSRLGITLPRATTRLNTTLSAEAMAVIQNHRRAVVPDDYRQLIPGLNELVAFLMKSRQLIPGQTRPAVKSSIAQCIRAGHRADSEFIHSCYGVDLGLARSGASAPISARSSWRVEDILESVDPAIVQRLMEEFRRAEPPRRRPLPIRATGWAYRALPYSRGLARLDAQVRTRFPQGLKR